MRRTLLSSICVFLLSGSLFMPFSNLVNAQETTYGTELDLGAKAAIAFDPTDGKIFYEKNSNEPLQIASTTKMLTMYLILQAIKDGTIHWDDEITISEHLETLSHDMNLSNVYLYQHEHYTVKDLFIATEKVSANAAVIALSEKIAGSEKEFVDLMRAQLKKWHIDNAYIISTSGLNNEDTLGRKYPGSKDDEENLMSAHDLAIVTYHLLNDFPEIIDFTREASATFGQGTLSQTDLISTNEMLPGQRFYKENVIGLKTGTTQLAGTCFVGLIEQDGRQVVTIVLHSEDMDAKDNGQRFIDTSNLMDDALENWQVTTSLSSDSLSTKEKNYPVHAGKKDTVALSLDKELTNWQLDEQAMVDQLNVTLDEDLLTKEGELKAPIKKGQKVGKISVSFNKTSSHYLFKDEKTKELPLYATETIEKSPWYVLIGEWFSERFHSLKASFV
ncbi:serine hydrolase [Vagococcus xieshaowenii]|uniref:serine-type D-Ala-D-Ala carboxypeptidase n=1 Tax=Vagococcus xieshaowenii TaxID=2562451 RepID=A0AAJ5JQR3_9ENTE|nr:serine hydrolase [Vagococcus xieshaowenii]QCA27859.1 D-alanyl-D-alanine carboxypeptidase [Vagococcus xieshaowenii]TFZ42428.1 D-alanyl-D-alanine carboxypeptidase [Vagococcus xieshaowenii]